MKRAIFLLMILPLSLVFINNTINRHQHILPDGVIVEHAHPMRSSCTDNSPGNEHKHTGMELILYNILTDSPVTVNTIDLTPEIFLLEGTYLNIPLKAEVFLIESVSTGLKRGPPC